MRKCIPVLFAMILLLPVACGKSSAVGESIEALNKLTAEVESTVKDLETAKTAEAVKKTFERFQKAGAAYQAVGETLRRFDEPGSISESDQQALKEATARFGQAGQQFMTKLQSRQGAFAPDAGKPE
jgi:hypothetical protein